MAAKKKVEETKVNTLNVNIPSLEDYSIPADPVTGQRASFTPYKMTLNKVGQNGTITLEHRTDKMVMLEDKVRVIFLHFPEHTQSQKMLKVDGQDKRVEFSYDMQWCTGGYPYKESPHTKDKDGSVTRLKKEAFFLVQDSDDESKVYLVRFNSVITNIRALQEISRNVHAEATRKYRLKSGSCTVVEIGINKENVNGFTVIRFKKDFQIIDQLSEDSFTKICSLAKEVKEVVNGFVDGARERAKERWAKTLEERALEAEKAVHSKIVKDTEPGTMSSNTPAAKTVEDTSLNNPTVKDDDDDLPF